MNKSIDRISEVYNGVLDTSFQEDARGRIHWICENAKGENILDIGCSQGIVSILLGREGKKVLGIDLSDKSIDYANEVLLEEEEATINLVNFKCANFMAMEKYEQKFDYIIVGHVLNQITDTKRFIQKALTLLNDNGRIIITVPFGINDHKNHKKTYYLLDVLKLQDNHLILEEQIKFGGSWIGVILKKSSEEQTLNINESLLHELEENFNFLEKYLRGTLIQNVIEKDINKIPVKEKESNDKKLQTYNEQILKKDKEIKELKNQISKNDKDIKILKRKEKAALTKAQNLKNQVIIVRKEKIKVQEDLLHSYKKEEMLLVSYQKLLKRYHALSESKLGRLTLAYWRKRRSKSFGGK